MDTSGFDEAGPYRSRVEVVCQVVAIISVVVTIVAVVVAVSMR